MKNKIIAIALALTTVMSVAPFAGAATNDDLQAQINQLSEQLKQISQILTALTAQGTITATPAVSASNCFTKTLQKGVTNDEVKALQTALKSDSSIYPEGLVTGYFGTLTEAAVKKFQAKYGIDQTGIVGPNTRAKLNSLYCATTTTPTTTTTATATATVTPTATVAPSYGTLSVNKVPVANPFSELYAGNTYEVFAAEFKATGSDITIRKIAINVTSTNIFPWQKFASISLWDGSTKLAELAVNQANLIENGFATDYTANISGLNIVVPNGQKKTITTKVTLLPALTTDAQKASFVVSMTNDIVYVDTAGVVYTNLSKIDGLTKTIGKAEESNKANFVVSTATDNPVAGNVVASKSNTTPVTLLSLSVKNDSDVSATINKASTTVVVNSTTTGQYITSVELWDGSTRIQTASANLSATTSANVTWENFTLPIAANTTKNLVVKAVVASLNNATLNGQETVEANNFWMQGIDANSNVVGPDTAAGYPADGNVQHIFLKAPVFALNSAVFTASAGDNDNPQSVGNAKISMNITAQGGSDIYIKTASTSLKIVQGTTTVASTSAFTCTSGAFDETGKYRIPAGNTAVCELNGVIRLTATNTQNGFYQLQVATITWSTDNFVSSTVAQDWGWDNFKTGLVNLIRSK